MLEKHYTTNPKDLREVLTAGGIPVHPLANIVPLDDDVTSLVTSISKIELLHPILMFKGRILDGRRRAIACKTLGIDPEKKELDPSLTDKELNDIAEAENATRRNLSIAQKAMIAVYLVADNSHTMSGYSRAVEYAKEVWNVSHITYSKAKYIYTYGRGFAPEIFSTGYADVDGKSMSMSKIYDMLKELNSKTEDDYEKQLPVEQQLVNAYQEIDSLKNQVSLLAQQLAEVHTLVMDLNKEEGK